MVGRSKVVQLKPGIRFFFELYTKFRTFYFEGMKVQGRLMHITGQGIIYFRDAITISRKGCRVNESKNPSKSKYGRYSWPQLYINYHLVFGHRHQLLRLPSLCVVFLCTECSLSLFRGRNAIHVAAMPSGAYEPSTHYSGKTSYSSCLKINVPLGTSFVKMTPP